MGEVTKIAWCDHTFNPWIGCTRVSPGCVNCYAEKLATRMGVKWGQGAERRITSNSNWKQLRRWDRKAAKDGVRRRVFIASLADVFDSEGPASTRDRLFIEIEDCPHLDFLLLTKRPENWASMLPARWLASWPAHVRLGFTAEDQKRFDARFAIAMEFRRQCVCLPFFVSVEPMVGPVTMRFVEVPEVTRMVGYPVTADALSVLIDGTRLIGWVICGGESGSQARPMHPSWAYSLRNHCEDAGVPFFFKQWGEWAPSKAKPVIGKRTGGDIFLKVTGAYGCQGDWWNGLAVAMDRVGKEAAGHLLDGKEHMEFPR